MFLRLFILFTIVPALEIYLLLRVGEVIGVLNTLVLILLTGVTGAYAARRQGLAILSRIQNSVQGGQVPGSELINGGMLVVGGTLLITPGFVTDLMGFALIFPPSRDILKHLGKTALQRRSEREEVRIVVDGVDRFP